MNDWFYTHISMKHMKHPGLRRSSTSRREVFLGPTPRPDRSLRQVPTIGQKAGTLTVKLGIPGVLTSCFFGSKDQKSKNVNCLDFTKHAEFQGGRPGFRCDSRHVSASLKAKPYSLKF